MNLSPALQQEIELLAMLQGISPAQFMELNLVGEGIFDALIAQAALKSAADRLLTLNPKHFTRLSLEVAQIVHVPQ